MKIRTILTSLALLALAAAPARATWTITSTSGSTRVITDGNWTLNLYNNYNGGDSVAYSSNAGNSTELDLTGVYADTGRTITRIDNQGFKDKKDITKIILPDSCKVMWNNAFQGCTALETVGIPSTFTTFNSGNMFDGCSALKTIYFTDETPEIGTVHLPEAITDIKGLMFSGCSSIEKVIAPGAVSIGDRAFQNCSSLTTVEISPSLSAMTSGQNFRGCSALTTVYPAGTTPVVGTVLLPDTLTVILGWGAFFDCANIEHVIARGVTDIAHQSFRGCTSLVSVEFSPNLAYLRTNATNSDNSPFYNCTSLTTFSPAVWGSVTIGAGTFRNCNSLTTYLDLSKSGITEIPSMWAAYTSLDGVTFPAGLTAFIGDQNFRELKKGAKFRFLGNRPTVTTTADKSPFYTKDKNNTSQRHVFIVDAATDPTWTNGTDFVAMADINSNNDTKNAFSASSADFPATKYPSEIHSEDVLGATIWGSGNGRYNWLVQYVDHSTVTATWMNGDHTFSVTEMAVGDAPTTPATTPTKASTDEFDYTFIGWNTDPDATTALDLSQISMTADMTFHAIYSAATRSYEIAWKLDADTLIDTTTVAYGATPTHADASKASDENYSYTFDGWSTDGSTVLAAIPAVTGPATYIAVFSQHALDTTVTISWLEENGATPLDPASTTVEKGTRPTHAEPTKEPDVGTVYTFDGWILVGDPNSTVIPSAELPLATVDCTYKAHFAASTRQYTVTFANWDGSVLTETAYDYGTPAASVVVPADPTRPATAEYTYAFSGWDRSVADVSSDATYTATYTETPNPYTATFVNGETGETISSATFAYGAAVAAPEPPAVEGHTFVEWSPAIGTMPAADTTYTATYAINKYTITWVNADGATIDTTSVDHGATPTHANPTKPSTAKASYAFAGWSTDGETVISLPAATGPATYQAVFSRTVLSAMAVALNSAAYDDATGEIAVNGSAVNAESGAGIDAAITSVPAADGTAAATGASILATLSEVTPDRGYVWTLSASQTAYGVTETAELRGRAWARAAKPWFAAGDVVWADGAYAPAAASGQGVQVRLRASVAFPAMLPRALPDAGSAAVGISAMQPNAGVAPAYYAWNGSTWVRLSGVYPKAGEAVALLGVVDFARKENGAAAPAVAWYADGLQLTTEAGDWEVPLVGTATGLARFAIDGDLAVSSFAADYDKPSGGTMILFY